MKLAEHVDHIRQLIEKSFDKSFARLGIGANKRLELEKLPEDLHEKRFRFEELLDNHTDETGSYASGREKALDELAFTLFNRIASIKVMEANQLFPPVITKEVEHGDRSFGHKAWLEERPDMRSVELEGIREYIKTAFDQLGEEIALFHKDYPYAYLPDAVSLNEIIDSFNAVEKDSQVEDNIWQSDDILGWLYESYNNAKKAAFKDSGAKTEYDKVSLQSQVYTPRWVVQFLVENSLGKLYLEMYPDSNIKNQYKIANAPETATRKIKPLEEIKLIDPASGSGNFLLYAFDFFYALYEDQIENYGADYEYKDLPQLIIENNLHGVDLDDRAIQLAQLGLYIKAKKKRRSSGNFQFKLVSSDFYLPPYEEVKEIFEEGNQLSKQQKELIAEIWGDLRFAHKFGSLVRIEEKLRSEVQGLYDELNRSGQGNLLAEVQIADHREFEQTFFANLKQAVEQYATNHGKTFLNRKTQDAILFLEIISKKYEIATANPPYTDSSDFGPNLKGFLEKNYKKPNKFHVNLYATFIKRCYELTNKTGRIAMIHPYSFMFIKSFEDVRKLMIESTKIELLVDWGLDRVNLFDGGYASAPTFYILNKEKSKLNEGVYFNLTNNLQEKAKKGTFLNALSDIIEGISNAHIYLLEQSKLKTIKSWPLIYWISEDFREKFGSALFENFFNIKNGLQTGNNNRYLRFWWEISHNQTQLKESTKWSLFAKGGPHNKWFGNLWATVNIQETNSTSVSKGYYREGLNFSGSSSKATSFRYMPEGNMFDNDAPLIFIKDYPEIFYTLGFLNSKLASYIIGCLNPTVKTQVGDIKRIPFSIPLKHQEEIVSKLSKMNIDLKMELCKYSLYEVTYEGSPYKLFSNNLKSYLNYENFIVTQILINESIINNNIFDVYQLNTYDKRTVLSKMGESIGSLPITDKARKAFLTDLSVVCKPQLNFIKDFINLLPIKNFTSDELTSIENDFDLLYQSNNNLEEFCVRHQVNPINVWYWFKESSVIPKQRMNTLAMEFLADMIREILMDDEDGIIPLIPNAGDKVLYDQIQDKFQEKGFSNAQFSSFDGVLGKELNTYLFNDFFDALSNHLNLFMYLPKTPFIWHLTSGPDHGFDAYIIIYKWSRDKLLRLKSVYVEQRERALVNRQTDLANDESASAQNEKDLISRQLREIDSFKVKIDELLEEGYNPILDDGVGKNIAPLQKKKMLAYDVLNAGQLKKYLNADW